MHEAHPFGPRTALALLLMAALCGAAGAAPGRADPKALARYDISYAQCEQQYAEMRGHRDEAYLNLYRVNPDAKALDDKRAASRTEVQGDVDALKTAIQTCMAEHNHTDQPATST